MNFAALSKFLPVIISAIVGIASGTFGSSAGWQIFQNGSGTPIDWASLIGGGGAGIVSLILGSKWFAQIKQPSPAVAGIAAATLYRYFPAESVESKQAFAMVQKIAGEGLKPPPPPKEISFQGIDKSELKALIAEAMT